MLAAGAKIWLFWGEDFLQIPIRDKATGTVVGTHESMIPGAAAAHRALMTVASGILVWTPAQAAILRARYAPRCPIVVMPPCLDGAFEKPARRGGPVRVGFGGSPIKYVCDIPVAETALRRLAARPDVEVVFWGGFPGQAWGTEVPAGRHRLGTGTALAAPFEWDYGTYLEAISDLDIAISPLAPTPFNASRWQGAWLNHAAFGTPMVVSDWAPYAEFEHGRTIVKVRTEDEWCEALTALVDDAALRQRIGQAAQAEMLQSYTTEARAPRWRAWVEAARAGGSPKEQP